MRREGQICTLARKTRVRVPGGDVLGPPSTMKTRLAAAYGNWKKLHGKQDAMKKREERIAPMRKARERAA